MLRNGFEDSFSRTARDFVPVNDNQDWTQTKPLLLLRLVHEYRYLKSPIAHPDSLDEAHQQRLMRDIRELIRAVWTAMETTPDKSG